MATKVFQQVPSPIDFTGLSIYEPTYVRANDSQSGFAIVPSPASYPHMYSPWLKLGPEALYWAPKLATDLWKLKEVCITENGASSADELTPEGAIYDTDLVMFLRNYLTQLHRAMAEGIPVKGYFFWSLLDNYEWAYGYDKRFGITYVDFAPRNERPSSAPPSIRKSFARMPSADPPPPPSQMSLDHPVPIRYSSVHGLPRDGDR